MTKSANPSLQQPISGLGERISAIARTVGSKRRLAAIAGVRESQLFRYIRGDNIPSLATAAALANAGEVSLEWLAYGRTSEAGDPQVKEAEGTYEADNDWVTPPLYAGGPGPVRLRRSWLEAMDLAAEHLLLAECTDDAMSPTLNRGDLVLADTRILQVPAAGLYLLRLDDQPVVRRASPLPGGGLRLDCDNSVYPGLQLTARERSELPVLGAIAWAGHRL